MKECLTPCQGNVSLACGSFWRNLVYNTTNIRFIENITNINQSNITLNKRSLLENLNSKI